MGDTTRLANVVKVVVALRAEARPLIEHYRLERVAGTEPYRVYRGEQLRLIVSGVGKSAAAAATGFLHAMSEAHRDTAWLNLGIAGAYGRAQGEAIIAHAIRDGRDGHAWQLTVPSALAAPTGVVVTVDRAMTSDAMRDLDRDWIFEMEAAGFYPTACRFAAPDQVFCLKVVSDNSEHPVAELDAKRAAELIAAQLDTVDRLLLECGPPAK